MDRLYEDPLDKYTFATTESRADSYNTLADQQEFIAKESRIEAVGLNISMGLVGIVGAYAPTVELENTPTESIAVPAVLLAVASGAMAFRAISRSREAQFQAKLARHRAETEKII